MFCYKDATFCPFYEDCLDAKGCRRALTPEVRAEAKRWWEGIAWAGGGSSAPICQFSEKPPCHRGE